MLWLAVRNLVAGVCNRDPKFQSHVVLPQTKIQRYKKCGQQQQQQEEKECGKGRNNNNSSWFAVGNVSYPGATNKK